MWPEPGDERQWHIVCMALALIAVTAGALGFGLSLNLLVISLMCTIVWLALFFVGLFDLGRRGLWLLVGLPFAMFWPVTYFVLIWGFGAELFP
jgi:hypothetical protein